MIIRYTRHEAEINNPPNFNSVFIDYYIDTLHTVRYPLNVFFLEPEIKENFLGYMLVHYPTEYAQIIDEEDKDFNSTFVLYAHIIGE